MTEPTRAMNFTPEQLAHFDYDAPIDLVSKPRFHMETWGDREVIVWDDEETTRQETSTSLAFEPEPYGYVSQHRVAFADATATQNVETANPLMLDLAPATFKPRVAMTAPTTRVSADPGPRPRAAVFA